MLAAGLALLARDVAWAARLLERVRRRMDIVPDRARRPILAATVLGALVASLVTAGFAF